MSDLYEIVGLTIEQVVACVEALCGMDPDHAVVRRVRQSQETRSLPIADYGAGFAHWSKDPLIPYDGCKCSSCEGARAPISISVTDGTRATCSHGKPVDDTEHQCGNCGPVESG